MFSKSIGQIPGSPLTVDDTFFDLKDVAAWKYRPHDFRSVHQKHERWKVVIEEDAKFMEKMKNEREGVEKYKKRNESYFLYLLSPCLSKHLS